MFLMIGISDGRKDLDFSQMTICDSCGAYGRLTVYMTYMALALFFIPIFKWNRKFYVQASCCGAVYLLDPEIGRRIARGEQLEIRPEHLTPVQGRERTARRCANCGYLAQEDFDFCPKCGSRL